MCTDRAPYVARKIIDDLGITDYNDMKMVYALCLSGVEYCDVVARMKEVLDR